MANLWILCYTDVSPKLHKVLLAILSDIHGNSAALKRVLEEAQSLGVYHLLILGDQIGYYYDACGVYDLLDSWSKDIIRGNHEDMLVGLIDHSINADVIKRKYGSALEIATRTLSTEKLELIKSHKRTERLSFDDIHILLAHGSPWNTDEYIYPDANRDRLEKCGAIGLDYVFLGHTHYPFIYKAKHSLIINPGSIGQSRVCGGIADWGILNTINRVYTPKHTPYDTKPICEIVEKTDPDVPYLRDILERNRSL
jgi:putative phosphoesterase